MNCVYVHWHILAGVKVLSTAYLILCVNPSARKGEKKNDTMFLLSHFMQYSTKIK